MNGAPLKTVAVSSLADAVSASRQLALISGVMSPENGNIAAEIRSFYRKHTTLPSDRPVSERRRENLGFISAASVRMLINLA